jgi:hypothetical protein
MKNTYRPGLLKIGLLYRDYMVKKDPWLYIILFLIVIAPGYLVWSRYPDIAAERSEGRDKQLTLIFLIAALPLIAVLAGIWGPKLLRG